jgi:hypothetical protein
VIAALAVLHLGAAVLLLFTPLPLWVTALLLILISVSGWQCVRVHGLRRGRTGLIALELDAPDEAPGVVQLHTQSRELRAELKSAYVHPWLVVLRVRCADRRGVRAVVLTADSVTAETFRQLRVRLRRQTRVD